MLRKPGFYIFITLSLVCLLAAFWLAWGQMQQYTDSLKFFPDGTTIANIPVGGLETQAAGLRLIQAYSQTPVELRVGDSAIQIQPIEAGLQLDLQGMLSAAEKVRTGQAFWSGYWDYLFNRLPAGFTVPLTCAVSAEKLHTFLQEQINTRYDQPPQPGKAVPADVLFLPGQPGTTLDLTSAEDKIRAAMCSTNQRVVALNASAVAAPALGLETLNPVLESLTQVSGFDGMIEVYFQDLRSAKEINFAFNAGHEVKPDIAFTGASTIKIPVMISAYKRIDGPLSDELRRRMELMIDLSDNSSTDEVMKQALDPNIGPVEVTQDMQALGLKNTFLAGFFYAGAPLLDRYNTPANQRTDLNSQPDIYNQTTAADMGQLLAAIERCAADGSGPLTQVFSGKITQAECQEMTGLLKKNRKGVLLEAGLPEGTVMAHKYGWVTDSTDGLLHTASDAAIVYTPGGNFVFTVYLYHPAQLPWDDAQRLVARMATAVYNFYNQEK